MRYFAATLNANDPSTTHPLIPQSENVSPNPAPPSNSVKNPYVKNDDSEDTEGK